MSKATACTEFSDKKKIVDALCLHYTVLVSLAELEQLRRGLAMQKFSCLMKSFPAAIRKAFEPPIKKITNAYIEDLFVADYSPVGSNKRVLEENILMTWVRYLQYVEGKIEQGIIEYFKLLLLEIRVITTPTLRDIMVFLTGCDSIPPLGFGDVSPAILFSDADGFLTVSTCSLTLTFPRAFSTDFQLFKERMTLAILGSQVFFGAV